MLTHIDIRDYTIVDHIDLDLAPGLTVLTGETGAGKSILVDALGLALGERADSRSVRPGAGRAEVLACFEVRDLPEVLAWLRDRELEQPDDECMLRRVLASDGRSRGYINGRPAALQDLRELGGLLVDVHGQHAHHSLLKRGMQRQILDAFGGLAETVAAVAAGYRRIQSLHREIQGLGGNAEVRSAELELLRYQVRELQDLSLEAGEMAALDEEHARLSNADRLLEGTHRTREILDSEQHSGVVAGLELATRQLAELQVHDPGLGEIGEMLEGALIACREAGVELRRYADHVELDPERLQALEQRLSEIHRLARKHHVEPEALGELQARLEQRLDDLEQGDARVVQLGEALEAEQSEYRRISDSLSRARAAAGTRLSEAVAGNMHLLGMPGGQFRIQLTPLPDGQLSAHGRDQVEFLVTTNPGQPMQPLSRVASGGELSRISLAIHVIGVGDSSVPTLIFDEVDVGIGGGVAEMVGQQLRHLGHSRQVLCITHLPQVASQGTNHLQVRKTTLAKNTATRVSPLDEDQRVTEIARMLGGREITDRTLAHAREMIQRGQAET